MKILNFFAAVIFTVILSSAFAYAGMAKEDIDILREQLSEHSLVVIRDGKTEVYDGRGIKPLVDYVRYKDFEKAYAGDKVIGKASALLFVYGGAKYVYTPLISKPAVEVFKKHSVKYSADRVVDNIKNRKGDDLCPMEKKVSSIDSPEEAYKLFDNIIPQ